MHNIITYIAGVYNVIAGSISWSRIQTSKFLAQKASPLYYHIHVFVTLSLASYHSASPKVLNHQLVVLTNLVLSTLTTFVRNTCH